MLTRPVLDLQRAPDVWDVNKFGLYIRCNTLIFEERINRKWDDENLIRVHSEYTVYEKIW